MNDELQELHDTQGLFRLLVASLCPVIYGQELTKAALILSLFGGGELRKDDMIPRRNDINVLMVGDPAMGKSQMLRAVSDIAPRCKYQMKLHNLKTAIQLLLSFFSGVRIWNWEYNCRTHCDNGERRRWLCG